MAEYIEREPRYIDINKFSIPKGFFNQELNVPKIFDLLYSQPAADVVEVVRCKDCKFATELDKHCDINRTAYKHCSLLRGDETKYVWHKYKKYYKDYSIVELDDFCSYGERRSEE